MASTTTTERKASPRAEYMRKYREEHREKERLRKREWRIKHPEKVEARNARTNAANGHTPRKVVQNPSMSVHVPKSRRYVVIAGKVYFNNELGFTAEDLKSALADLRASIRR